MAFIEFINVEKAFRKKKVLQGVNLNVEKGETLTVLGGSGSGKTVLLKILLRLFPADRGRILFEGKDVMKMGEEELSELRTRVAMVFQGGALFDSMTVRENIAYPLREHFDYDEDKISAIVSKKLEMVGLSGMENIENTMPADLSGGMKKRVALARSIATDPEVILYDEPTTGLDPINTQRINGLIMDLRKKLNMTSIVVTHDMESAFKISDRIAFLYQGKIEFLGTPDEVQKSNNPRVKNFITGGDYNGI